MQMVHRRYFISYRPTGLFVFFSHLKNNVSKPSTWAYYNTLHSGVQGQALTNKQAMLSNFRIYSGNFVKQAKTLEYSGLKHVSLAYLWTTHH